LPLDDELESYRTGLTVSLLDDFNPSIGDPAGIESDWESRTRTVENSFPAATLSNDKNSAWLAESGGEFSNANSIETIKRPS
jgi:hypothetical protein